MSMTTIRQCPGCHTNVSAVVMRGNRRMCYDCQPLMPKALRQARYRQKQRLLKTNLGPPPKMIRCLQCETDKPENEFYKRNLLAKNNGRRCKKCVLYSRMLKPNEDAMRLMEQIKVKRAELDALERQLEEVHRRIKAKKVADTAIKYVDQGMSEQDAVEKARSENAVEAIGPMSEEDRKCLESMGIYLP